MTGRTDDWVGVVDRLLAGDRLALLEIDRLITGVLVQVRAYDVHDEWDDLRGEVSRALVERARAGRLRDGRAVTGYVRILTRHKVVERLKASLRQRAAAAAAPPPAPGPDVDATVGDAMWSAVANLPPDQRLLVGGVYREGRTYQAVAEEAGVAPGAVKRRLREAFAILRRRLTGDASLG
jgi:DNA-directed RNA polymerase specialized sigma24 family protein